MTPAEIALTLGVYDLKATKGFYSDGLGCPVDKSFGGKFASFNLGAGSATLALYTRESLAKDAGVPVDGHGFPGVTLLSVVATKDEAVATIDRAERAGGKIAAPVGRVKSGSYRGHFSDPDGFVWSVSTAS
jgi:hypothetical protein